ncbi:MAG: ABC transporter permease subunit [Anaerolineae bacterium]|nr:ABC transporter permease subunit [Anaerolineae bacterium]
MNDLPEEKESPERSSYETIRLERDEIEAHLPYKTVKLEPDAAEEPAPHKTALLEPEGEEPPAEKTVKMDVLPAEPEAPETPASPPPAQKKGGRSAIWWQFPRRVVLLLAAFGLALAFLAVMRLPVFTGAVSGTQTDWSTSWVYRESVADIVREGRSNTLLLIGLALVLALLNAAFTVLVAALVHALEKRSGPLGSIAKGLGRLWAFGWATGPVLSTAILLFYVFVLQLDLLPPGGLRTPGSEGTGDLLLHLILPVVTLAFLPGLITGQVVARYVTIARAPERGRPVLAALFKGLGTLLGQMGGLLGAALAVEIVFNLPGLGRLFIQSIFARDLPVTFGVLRSYAVLILIFRIAAELFHWLERFVGIAPAVPQPAPTRWRKFARVAWVVLAVLCLVFPVVFAGAGLLTGADAAVDADLSALNAPPSAEHLLGTDHLGRDVLARTLRGAATTLGVAALAALVALIPAALGGALTGYLSTRGKLWAESLADVLLLPADVLLFFPVAGGVALLSALAQPANVLWLLAAVFIVPRATRLYHALWGVAPDRRKALALALGGPTIVFLGALFIAAWAIPTVEHLGLGAQPPASSLGSVLQDIFRVFDVNPGILAAIVVLWASGLAFYVATEALVGFFNGKDALARLNM